MARTRASSFARKYHSKERVRFVKAMGCRICGWESGEVIENAHMTSGGMGRKSDYDQIVPLCRQHHMEYDGGKKSFCKKYDFDPQAEAERTERQWRDWGGATG